nr:hypothetical protein [Tanacetum cinerariifolium]
MKDKDDGEGSGSDVVKNWKTKDTKKQRKLGSPSISRNLKVNEMLYKSLNEQNKKKKERETSEKASKEYEDEANRKAEEASEQERKEAEDEAKRKEKEDSEKARKQAQYVLKRKANEEVVAKAKAEEEANKKAAEEDVIKKAGALEAKTTEEDAMKKASEEEPIKQATGEHAIKKATKKGIKADKGKAKKKASKGKHNDENVDKTGDVGQTDNEEDDKETDDVEQVLKKIPTMPVEVTPGAFEKMKKDEEEKHMGSDEEDVFYDENESENEGLFVAKEKEPAKMKKKTQASTLKANKLRNSKSEEEEYTKSEEEQEERYELIQTLRDGMNKLDGDQTMSDFCKEYKQVFNNVDFNLDDSFMDEYSDRDEMILVKERKRWCEPKDDREKVQAKINNEPKVKKVIEENNEAAFSMNVDDQNEENIKEKEHDKERVSEKKGNEKERNENKGNDNMNKNEINNDELKKEQQVETKKEKEAKIKKLEHNQGNNDQ